MTIDEAIRLAEIDARLIEEGELIELSSRDLLRHLALLRFVQAWDAFRHTDDIDSMIAARDAVDEALK